MILHAEYPVCRTFQPLDCAIQQIDMGAVQGRIPQTAGFDGVGVILRGDARFFPVRIS